MPLSEILGVLRRDGLAVTALASLAGVLAAVIAACSPIMIGLMGLLAGTMAATAVVDLRTLRIPDLISLPLVLIGLLASGGTGLIVDPEHLIAALGGGAVLWLLRAWTIWRFGAAGVGLGDVKLVAAGGAWLGLEGLSAAVGIGACAGVILHLLRQRGRVGRGDRVPFGVTLAPAIAGVAIWQLF